MTLWTVPDHFRDELPPAAEQLETLRRRSLALLRSHGYQLVAPPLLEYLEALTVGSGRDLAERTFQVVDPVSGKTLAVRPDMTPQIARIDAHLLNREGVTRLCYCGPVAHARPANLLAVREPWQLGAELYGHAGVEADIEVARLLLRLLEEAGLAAIRLEFAHMAIFRALTAGWSEEEAETLFGLLRAKNRADLADFVAGRSCAAEVAEALLWLPHAYGGAEVVEEAQARLPAWPEIAAALAHLRAIAEALAEEEATIGFDLADLRGYHYHTGVMFAAFVPGSAAAVALGGRYDGMGAVFGRARAATGFSIDLRSVQPLLPLAPLSGAILAPMLPRDIPCEVRAQLVERVRVLRAQGEVVVDELPGHSLASWQEAGCTRRLVWEGGAWSVVPIEKV
ncbi:ATP phosphoribosyltransferase regulatory subunit [Hydrogenophilus islandicus]